MTDLDHPHYELGLIHDHGTPEALDLATFAEGKQPTPPPSVSAPKGKYPMACNDTEGDCTVAGATHYEQAGAIITDEPWTYQGDAATNKVYRQLTGGGDTGLMLPQVLKPWHLVGLWNGAKNGGYSVVHPKDTTGVKRSIWIFGGAYIAVNLPAVAQQQFKADGTGVWELTHTSADNDIEGGHCVVPIGYTAEGVVTVTWGGLVLITWEWWARYVTQVYAVVPPAFVAKGGDGRGYDLAAIDAYLPQVAA